MHKRYYNIENYSVQTRSQARSTGIKCLEVHGMGKNLDPNIKPEKQHANPIKGSLEKPCIGQGRAGIEKEKGLIQSIKLSFHHQNCHRKFLETKIETGKTNHIHSKDQIHFVDNVDERDDTYKTFNLKCSLPSRSNL